MKISLWILFLMNFYFYFFNIETFIFIIGKIVVNKEIEGFELRFYIYIWNRRYQVF